MRPLFRICLTTFLFITFLIYLCVHLQITNIVDKQNFGQHLAFVEGWEFNTSRDTSLYINNKPNMSAILMPERFCDSESFLLIIVCSGPSNFDAREAIRETWGTKNILLGGNNGNNASLYFLLGETNNSSLQIDIELENEKYSDIIQERFIDSYNNLTLKSVNMLKLVSNFCANTTKFLFKIDDDMFVNTNLLIKYLHSINQTKNILIGNLICGAKPITDSTNKWFSPRYMYPGRIYPNYLSGTGYVMSIDVAQKLYKTALKTPVFHLEDVYVTGICSRIANIKPRNNPRFTYQRFTFTPCLLRELFTAHHFNSSGIHTTFELLKNDKNLKIKCDIQKKSFNVNNWIANNIFKTDKSYRKNKCQ